MMRGLTILLALGLAVSLSSPLWAEAFSRRRATFTEGDARMAALATCIVEMDNW